MGIFYEVLSVNYRSCQLFLYKIINLIITKSLFILNRLKCNESNVISETKSVIIFSCYSPSLNKLIVNWFVPCSPTSQCLGWANPIAVPILLLHLSGVLFSCVQN